MPIMIEIDVPRHQTDSRNIEQDHCSADHGADCKITRLPVLMPPTADRHPAQHGQGQIMKRRAGTEDHDTVALRSCDNVVLPHRSGPSGFQQRPDNRGLGAEQVNSHKVEEKVAPELLHRESGQNDPGGAQLAVAGTEEPEINCDPGGGGPDHRVRPRKYGKAQRRGDNEIAWPRHGRRIARTKKIEDDVPSHVLKKADIEECLERNLRCCLDHSKELVEEKDYGSPDENSAPRQRAAACSLPHCIDQTQPASLYPLAHDRAISSTRLFQRAKAWRRMNRASSMARARRPIAARRSGSARSNALARDSPSPGWTSRAISPSAAVTAIIGRPTAAM